MNDIRLKVKKAVRSLRDQEEIRLRLQLKRLVNTRKEAQNEEKLEGVPAHHVVSESTVQLA